MYLLLGRVRLVPLFLPGVLCLSKQATLDSKRSYWPASYNPGWDIVGLEKLGELLNRRIVVIGPDMQL